MIKKYPPIQPPLRAECVDLEYFQQYFPDDWRIGEDSGWGQAIGRKFETDIEIYQVSSITGFRHNDPSILELNRLEVSHYLGCKPKDVEYEWGVPLTVPPTT